MPAIAVSLCSLGPAKAMDAKQVLQSWVGHTLSGEYASGARFQEDFHADGTTRYSDASATIEGRVVIREEKLCFSYSGKEALEGDCFAVETRGANCFDFYAKGNTADAFQRRAGLGWSARAWRDDQPSTCVAAVTS